MEAPDVEWRGRKSSRVVRLEVDADTPPQLTEFLVGQLSLDSAAAYTVSGPLDLSAAAALSSGAGLPNRQNGKLAPGSVALREVGRPVA
jgi:polyphosphate kinase